MKKINLNLNIKVNPKKLLVKFNRNLSWLFFAALVALIVLEVFELNKSAQMILKFNQEAEITNKPKGVRINFDDYSFIVKRIEEAENFKPLGGITKNPFNPGQTLLAPFPAEQNSAAPNSPTNQNGLLQVP